MTDTTQLRMTIVVDYEAHSRHYDGTTNPHAMARIDEKQLADNRDGISFLMTWNGFDLTVEPLLGGPKPANLRDEINRLREINRKLVEAHNDLLIENSRFRRGLPQ